MRNNKIEVYLHFVWATWDREPIITAELERHIYRCIWAEAEQHSCRVIEIGGVEDHVYTLLKFPSTITIADLVQGLKGSSSHFVNHEVLSAPSFRWQGGYGVFSVSRWDIRRIRDYIRSQRQHHQDGSTIPLLEEITEDDA